MPVFYAAKVIREDGSRSNLITLFADTDEDAKAQVLDHRVGQNAAEVHVANISESVHREQFRGYSEDFGIQEHRDYTFTDDGPINVARLFEAR